MQLTHTFSYCSMRLCVESRPAKQLISMCIVCLGTEWVDPEDPTVIAETELLGAAASIEAAAKKLEQLKPRAKPRVMHMLYVLFKDSPRLHL